jgi:hypothetical protein
MLFDRSLRFLVLVNNTPTGFFCSSYGLRKGGPLSPFLFVLVMKALGRMIFAIVSGGLLSGFFVSMLVGLFSLTFCLLMIL